MLAHWLFLDLGQLFCVVRAAGAARPAGETIGVALLMAETTCCLAASRQAKKYGVEEGTLIAEVCLLCPEITFVLLPVTISIPSITKRSSRRSTPASPIDSILSIDEMICETGPAPSANFPRL